MEGSRVLAQALPAETRVLAEALAERVDLGTGTCRLVLELHDGVLRHILRQSKVNATDLARFDAGDGDG